MKMSENDQYTDERRLLVAIGEMAERAGEYHLAGNVAGMTFLADNPPKGVDTRGAYAVASAMASEQAGRHEDGNPARAAWTKVADAYAQKAGLGQAEQPKD